MILDAIRRRAIEHPKRILLADATDPRVISAAKLAASVGIATIEFVGDRNAIEESIAATTITIDEFKIWSPDKEAEFEIMIQQYYDLRKMKVTDLDTARNEVLSDPILFGALLVRSGYADGLVAGSLSTTAAVIRAGLRGIGLSENVRTLSSMFLMDFPALGEFRSQPMTLGFADCAVVPDPDAHALADIAITTAESYQNLTGIEARVAMLSFSTMGSASNDSTKKVALATEIAKERKPQLLIDGELQFDAAFVRSVAHHKATGSPLDGNANVFIFPNLDAGNIGYKIAERLGMGQAIGPILQGLAKPLNDLSRGASVEDIVTMIAVTSVL